MAGEPITAKLTRAPGDNAAVGGLKVARASGWFLARSVRGAENIYKIYTESFGSESHLEAIVKEASANTSTMPFDDRGQIGTARRSEWDRRIRRAANLAERPCPCRRDPYFLSPNPGVSEHHLPGNFGESAAVFGSAVFNSIRVSVVRRGPALLKLVRRCRTKKLKQAAGSA